MPHTIKQKVALELTRKKTKQGRKLALRYGRMNKDGKIGWASKDWIVGAISMLPRPVFWEVLPRIAGRYKKLPEHDRGFETQFPEIHIALCAAASACGCEAMTSKQHGGVNWKLDGKLLVTFAIVNCEKRPDRNYKGKARLAILRDIIREKCRAVRKMEEKHHALYRMAIVVLKNSPPKILAFDTRKK